MVKGKRYTRETIIKEIKQAWEEGRDLRSSAIQKTRFRGVYRYCGNHFANWNKALEAADINYEMVEQRESENKKQVFLNELQKAYENGIDLSAGVLRKSSNKYLYNHSLSIFPNLSWHRVLAKAGLPIKEIRRKRENRKPYSKLEITLKIIELNNNGINLNRTDLLTGEDKILSGFVNAANRLFEKGWPEAVSLAGVSYDRFRKKKSQGYWDNEKIIHEIKKIKEKGEPLNSKYALDNYRALHQASFKHLGSWNNALIACDINPKEVRVAPITLSKEKLIEKIKNLHKEKKDLSYTGIYKNGTMGLYQQSCKKFGSWRKAIKSAGISYKEIKRNRIKLPSLDEIVESVKEFENKGIDLHPISFKENFERKKIYESVKNYCNSWNELLKLAEVDKPEYHIITDLEDKEQVLEYLRVNYESGVVTGDNKDEEFISAAENCFGTISNAVEAADFIYSRDGKITKKMLKNPKNIGILYKNNESFLNKIASKIYFRSKFYEMRTLDREELINQAFVKFIEFLPKKPEEKGIRQFSYWPVYKSLVNLNINSFKEISYNENGLLDRLMISK